MRYVEIGLLLVGVAMLVWGYRRNSRGTLVSVAVILILAGTVGDFADG